MARPEIVNEDQLVAVPLGKRAWNFKDLTGQKFGRLTVLSFAGRDSVKRRTYYNVKCDCGNCFKVMATHLMTKHTESCGCIHTEVNYRHGLVDSRLYSIWEGIKARCFNPNNPRYVSYGDRGITLYSDWVDDPEAFVDWINSNLGPRPTKMHSLDRIDNNRNYEPGNLRWADPVVQAYNKRISHGYARTPTYESWKGMCNNNKQSVCSRWLTNKGGGFKNFLADMGVKPDGSKLHRPDKSQPYSPTNCEWR